MNTTHTQAIDEVTEAFHAADANVVETGKTLATLDPADPLYMVIGIELDSALLALDKAADDLREVRDGYRYTFPHPNARWSRTAL